MVRVLGYINDFTFYDAPYPKILLVIQWQKLDLLVEQLRFCTICSSCIYLFTCLFAH